MKVLSQYEVWFVTGSQDLYGPETLKKVAEHSQEIATALQRSEQIPVHVVFKPVLTNPDAIYQLCQDANLQKNCIGLITWMHTFSPAKMWIAGLKALQKPFVHLHTQYNRDLPWADIDMNFMNLNQSAHGDREFGFIGSRLRLNRKVIVGFWQDPSVQEKLATWMRAACAWNDSQGVKIARFGDNMREVAVTEGDKVEAQIRFGYSVRGYGIGDLVDSITKVNEADVTRLVKEYEDTYTLTPELRADGNKRSALQYAAKVELGLRAFLERENFKGFTTCFEDLHGMDQLPGLSVQRLMADGYGFGAEGDWKTAALVRAMKVMGSGLKGGCSFMEDYTYHLDPAGMQVLGAHMLELCASIAGHKPSLQIHPLSIGGKSDPLRLIFNVALGPALNASIIDMGNRFRMVVNTVEVVAAKEMPNLPVARAMWIPEPNLAVAAAAWILAGAAHHAAFSQAVSVQCLEDFAEMADVEFLLINKDTNLSDFKKELRWNSVYYR
jgi:L-arabinose isomerase